MNESEKLLITASMTIANLRNDHLNELRIKQCDCRGCQEVRRVLGEIDDYLHRNVWRDQPNVNKALPEVTNA